MFQYLYKNRCFFLLTLRPKYIRLMVINDISNFVSLYIDALSSQLSLHDASYRLSLRQRGWLAFCITGLLLSNEINWSAYSRFSFGYYKISALSWMFRHSKINFDALFRASIRHILSTYGLTSGHIVFDDTDNERSKNALHIHGLGTQKGNYLAYPRITQINTD